MSEKPENSAIDEKRTESVGVDEIYARFLRRAAAFMAAGENAHVAHLAASACVCSDPEGATVRGLELLLQQALKNAGLHGNYDVERMLEQRMAEAERKAGSA